MPPGEDEYEIGHLEQVDEVFQEEELSTSFHIDPAPALDSLVAYVNDLTFPERRRRQPQECRVSERTGSKPELVTDIEQQIYKKEIQPTSGIPVPK